MNRALVRIFAALALLSAVSCTRTGLNAGERGGLAFIGLTVMLLIVGALLWVAIGRGD